MTDFIKAILDAQPYALCIVAGILFIAIGVVGSVKTYIDPGVNGRIAAGIIGVVLLLSGFYMYAKQSVQTSPEAPSSSSAANPQPVASSPTPKSNLSSIAGVWRGVVEIPNEPLHFVLHINSSSDGISATADSPDQNANALPVDTISLDGNHLSFTMSYLDVRFDGELKGIKGTRISGIFLQHGQRYPLTLVRD